MKSIVKRRYKKYSKNYLITSCLLILLFILSLIVLINFESKLSMLWLTIFGVLITMTAILAAICNAISVTYSNKLKQYAKAIREYRIRKEYCKALRLIESQDLNASNQYL